MATKEGFQAAPDFNDVFFLLLRFMEMLIKVMNKVQTNRAGAGIRQVRLT